MWELIIKNSKMQILILCSCDLLGVKSRLIRDVGGSWHQLESILCMTWRRQVWAGIIEEIEDNQRGHGNMSSLSFVSFHEL